MSTEMSFFTIASFMMKMIVSSCAFACAKNSRMRLSKHCSSYFSDANTGASYTLQSIYNQFHCNILSGGFGRAIIRHRSKWVADLRICGLTRRYVSGR